MKQSKRIAALLLSAAMIFQSGIMALAARGDFTIGSSGAACPHHIHDESCGYTEALPGADCTHTHDDACGFIEAVDEVPCDKDCADTDGDGEIDHGEDCAYTPAVEGASAATSTMTSAATSKHPSTPCTFVCDICHPLDTGKEEPVKPEDTIPENTKPEDAETENTALCAHHQEHTEDCGFVPVTEDGDGSPCTYACRICPIEDLIAALPNEVTEDNADDVRARLDEILALFAQLTEEEQGQIDLSRCMALQEALDAANAPIPAADYNLSSGSLTVTSSNQSQYDGTVVTSSGTTTNRILIDGAQVSLTISDLKVKADRYSAIELANGAELTLNLSGANTLEGYASCAGIKVPQGCTLIIQSVDGSDSHSLKVDGGSGGAGIGAPQRRESLGADHVETVGTIIINSGTVTAQGRDGGAGIGGTVGNVTGSVTINGGIVNASGSSGLTTGYAAGIGGGNGGWLENITITGGTVTARGSEYAAGIGAGGSGGGEYRCGDISITGGTIRDTVIGFSSKKTGGGTITIENAVLENCELRPAPSGWKQYTINGTVLDESLTSSQPATLLAGCIRYPVSLKANSFKGSFSTTVHLPPELTEAEFVLTLQNGNSFRQTAALSGDTLSLDFGELQNVLCNLNVFVYIASKPSYGTPVTVAACGNTYQTTLKHYSSQSEYCFYFTVTDMKIPADKENEAFEATITIGGDSWNVTVPASGEKRRKITIGSLPHKVRLIFKDKNITGDISGVSITSDLPAGQFAGTGTLIKEVQGRGYLEVTTIDGNVTLTATVPGLNGGNPITKTVNIASNTKGIDFFQGESLAISDLVLDLAYGDITFAPSGDTMTVTGYNAQSEKVTANNVPYDAEYRIYQSSPTEIVSRILISGTGGNVLRLKLDNINLKINGESAISMWGGSDVVLSTVGENKVTSIANGSNPSIYVDPDSRLTLSGNGSLTATTQDMTENIRFNEAAGIGGSKNSGTITIESGTVTANGGYCGAGIGGGSGGAGNVTINGGTVTATGGKFGAGIGGGWQGAGTVTITGGTVTATGGSSGAGIGGGQQGGGNVTITGGTVTATGGRTGAGIGGGSNKTGTVTINGGTIKASGDVQSPKNDSGEALTRREITLSGVGDDVLITEAGGYGVNDVYTRDGGKLYFYLPGGWQPETISAGDTAYGPETVGGSTYVLTLPIRLADSYPLKKTYDGIPLANPTADQVEGNVDYNSLNFEWYQGNQKLDNPPVDVGKYILRVRNDAGTSRDFAVAIEQSSLADAEVTLFPASFTYDGNPKTPTVTVEKDGALVDASQCDIAYSNTNGGDGNHTNAGTVTVTVTAKADGNYTGSNSAQFTIVPKPVTATVTAENKPYDGTNKATVKAEVKSGDLEGNDSITITGVTGTFADANIGTGKTVRINSSAASVSGTGSENYKVSFPEAVKADINPAAVILTFNDQEITYGETPAPATADPAAQITYSYTGTTSGNGWPTDAGTYTVTAKVAATGNYGAATATAALTIKPKPVIPTVTLPSNSFAYTGSEIKPTVTVKDGNTVIPASEYEVEYQNNVNAGTATVIVKDKDGGNYVIGGTPAYFTITRVNQAALKITGVSGSVTYGDNPFTLGIDGGSGTGLVSWNIISGPATIDTNGKVTITGAGSVTVKAAKAGDNNHNPAEAEMTFTVHKKALAVAGVTAENRAYNGSNTVKITGVTLSGKVGNDNVSVDTSGLTGAINGADVGHYDAVTLPTLTLTGSAGDNYTLPHHAGAVPTNVTISKATPLTPKTGDLAVANKQAHTYIFGLGALRPDAPAGMSLGSTAVTYELGTVSLGSYYDDVANGAKIEGQTLTVPVKEVESNSETGIGTITVIIHTGNFADMTATINVRSVNKIIPEGAPTLTTTTLTYGQPLSTIKLSGSMKDGTTDVPGTFSWSSPENKPAVQEHYEAAWTFTPEDNRKYAIVTGTSVIQVVPAPITGAVIELNPTAFRYDGSAHRPDIADVKLGDTVLTADVDYTAEVPTGTEAKTYTVTITGKGNYTGTATTTFTINPVEQQPIDQKDKDGHELRLEVETGISEVPEGLENIPELNTPEKLELAMKLAITQLDTDISQANTAVYDVTLMVSKDGGQTWSKATAENFPANGKLTVTLPYPDGTDSSYQFKVAHMFTTTDFGKTPGATENPAVTNTADGIQFVVTGLSPIAVGWSKPGSSGDTGGNTDGGNTGGDSDSNNRDDAEYDFWQEVREKIEGAKSGDIIKVNARSYDKMPYSVMRALRENSGVSLVIRWDGGEDIVIPAGKAQPPESLRIYYPLSLLAQLYAEMELTNPETGGPIDLDKLNPATGGVWEVNAPITAKITQPQAGDPQITDPRRGLAETPELAEEGIEKAIPDVFQPEVPTETAVSTGEKNSVWLAVLAIPAAVAGGLVFWKKRQTEKK